MRIVLISLAAAGLAVAACSPQDQAAEKKADALEAQAAATPDEAKEKALNAEADRVEQQAGNADGGATTSNTPNTSPSR
ncbi:MAG: hypothetical protein BGN86_11755 [Caulobacterales bacterium 68-7]|nr:MAG: hypothetical protein BGN86_11755 [Caulobacterales bacterium 68-7]